MRGFRLLRRGWDISLAQLIRGARASLLISSPYVTQEGARIVASNVSGPGPARARLTVVTSLSPVHICQGSTDPRALKTLAGLSNELDLFHLHRLHAKAYVADKQRAIVTSANLTGAGLFLNYEYGCEITDCAAVEKISQDIRSYAELGALVTKEKLDAYCEVAAKVQSAFSRHLADASRAVRSAFKRALHEAEDELVRLQLAGGATHTVFAKTVLYLLRRRGPLRTVELHPLIQAIHPDLCDDTVDRVIDGQRFGKKWKHAVRTAQQQLKKKGLVDLHAGEWMLAPGA